MFNSELAGVFMGLEVVNLTPHPISLVGEDGEKHTFPPSGDVARVNMEATEQPPVHTRAGLVPVVFNAPGKVDNLPDPKENTIYIVSSIVLNSVRGRSDVFAPDTGKSAIRNNNGQIEAVRQLVTNHQTHGICDYCGQRDQIADWSPRPICYMCLGEE